MRYGFILDHATVYAIVTMCRVLQVSKAGYYAWRTRRTQPSQGMLQRAQSDQELTKTIREIHGKSREIYGSPRVREELKARSIPGSKTRVERLMREAGLAGKSRRRSRVRTTDSAHRHPVAENLVDRQFTVATKPEALNRVWVSDITYVPTLEGWFYLAVVLDVGSRRVIGWSMGQTLERSLAIDALTMALQGRHPVPHTLTHHSDRGSQYACTDYRTILSMQDITCSMSRKGNCWDNAVAESFFATFKTELIDDVIWQTREHARRAIFEYIEVWYNRERRHSSLGYLSPAAFEESLLRSNTANVNALVA
jgi:transposase InsO family protein